MIGGDPFDVALDRCLAARREPQLPDGIARRIVVRTVHLPQFQPTVCDSKAVRPSVPASTDRKWSGWRYGLGGAIAASLTAAMFVGGVLGPSYAPGAQAPAPTVASERAKAAERGPSASSGSGVATMLASAASSRAEPPRETHVASGQVTDADTRRTREGERSIGSHYPSLAVAGAEPEATQANLARNPLPDASPQVTGEAFALSDERAPPARVYGPVLEPEWDVRSSAAVSERATGLGIAASGRAIPASSTARN